MKKRLRFEFEVGAGLAPCEYAVNRDEFDESSVFKGRVLHVVSAPAGAEIVAVWCPWPERAQMPPGGALPLSFSAASVSLAACPPRKIKMQVRLTPGRSARGGVCVELEGACLQSRTPAVEVTGAGRGRRL